MTNLQEATESRLQRNFQPRSHLIEAIGLQDVHDYRDQHHPWGRHYDPCDNALRDALESGYFRLHYRLLAFLRANLDPMFNFILPHYRKVDHICCCDCNERSPTLKANCIPSIRHHLPEGEGSNAASGCSYKKSCCYSVFIGLIFVPSISVRIIDDRVEALIYHLPSDDSSRRSNGRNSFLPHLS
ncbi:uncharacterized protein LOC124413678 [Diprion similis]|uniref:uncharacterized protein LOC124413678 n=1 Tax=Diprion similis TaxID=362088 RepID=UPI001EF88087|nr:uncharacterized protein LOC124413678 [Diprion similis]